MPREGGRGRGGTEVFRSSASFLRDVDIATLLVLTTFIGRRSAYSRERVKRVPEMPLTFFPQFPFAHTSDENSSRSVVTQ